VRKVICLVGYYGGFRNIELKSLLFENVECDSMGYWFSFSRSKQRNRLEETTICVPRRQKDWISCVEDSARKAIDYDPASLIDSYYEAVMQDLNCKLEDLKGGFFKGTHGKSGKRFVNSNIGKNTLGSVGVEVASELCLRDPETFTGHCWRRSAGTNASNSGVNVTTLMSMMGWACPKTAMQYVKRSRITSLKMSMYLANVQRRNVPDPFPTRTVRESRKSCFSGSKKSKNFVSSNVVENSGSKINVETTEFVESVNFDSVNLQRTEMSCLTSAATVSVSVSETVNSLGDNALTDTTPVSSSTSVRSSSVPICSSINSVLEPTVSNSTLPSPVITSSSSIDLSSIDSRLLNVLSNLQNHGSIQIHFNFSDSKK